MKFILALGFQTQELPRKIIQDEKVGKTFFSQYKSKSSRLLGSTYEKLMQVLKTPMITHLNKLKKTKINIR